MDKNTHKVECTIPVLPVANLAASVGFYTQTLGFVLDWGNADADSVCSVSKDGRPIMLMERPAPVMFHSLTKLLALPATTTLYCGHEYTLNNARFALTIDPTNSALKERAAKVEKLRAEDKPTLPTTLAEELATNPFIRWHDPAIRRNLGMEKATDAEVFAEIRKRKDNF